MWLHLLRSSSMLLPGENNAQERPFWFLVEEGLGLGLQRLRKLGLWRLYLPSVQRTRALIWSSSTEATSLHCSEVFKHARPSLHIPIKPSSHTLFVSLLDFIYILSILLWLRIMCIYYRQNLLTLPISFPCLHAITKRWGFVLLYPMFSLSCFPPHCI